MDSSPHGVVLSLTTVQSGPRTKIGILLDHTRNFGDLLLCARKTLVIWYFVLEAMRARGSEILTNTVRRRLNPQLKTADEVEDEK